MRARTGTVSGGVTARGFHTHARAFSDAAEAVRAAQIADPLPVYFLWGRTIELALKSFLIADGVPLSKLKSQAFGHDLEALLTEAKARGLCGYIGRRSVDAAIVKLMNMIMLASTWNIVKQGLFTCS